MNQARINEIKNDINAIYTPDITAEKLYLTNKGYVEFISNILLLEKNIYPYTGRYFNILAYAKRDDRPMAKVECMEFIKDIYNHIDYRSAKADIFLAMHKTLLQYKRLNKKNRVSPFKFITIYIQYNFRDILIGLWNQKKKADSLIATGDGDVSIEFNYSLGHIDDLISNRYESYIHWLNKGLNIPLSKISKKLKIRYPDLINYLSKHKEIKYE